MRVKTDEYGARQNLVAGTGQPAWASRTLRPIAFIKLLFPTAFTPNSKIPDTESEFIVTSLGIYFEVVDYVSITGRMYSETKETLLRDLNNSSYIEAKKENRNYKFKKLLKNENN